MSSKTPIHRAWCGVCRSFTNQREMPTKATRKLECIACREDRLGT
jgi:hypothetical protein